MEHWSIDNYRKLKEQGFKYAVRTRRGYSESFTFGVNLVNKIYDIEFIKRRTDNKVRISIQMPEDNDHESMIMYHDNDGKYWVIGFFCILERI